MSKGMPTVPKSGYLEDVGLAIGRIPTGVFVVTALDAQKNKHGMMASWVMQTSFDPPAICVAVHPERDMYRVIQDTRRFTLNVLSTENHTLMKAFSRYSPDQFDQVAHQDSAYGLILNDAVSMMHCRLLHITPAGDHHLFIAQVEGGLPLNPQLSPFVHLRKTGFSY